MIESFDDGAALIDCEVGRAARPGRCKTADSHRSRLMKKLEMDETAGLVRYAIRRGVVEP